jgi:hypothetical protein
MILFKKELLIKEQAALSSLFIFMVRRNKYNKKFQGERRDLNPQPPGPQPGALPVELRSP